MRRPPHLEWPVFRWVRIILELGGGFALCVAFLYVALAQQYEAFAKAIVPILATYIATAALLYNRARALPRVPSKTRSLYAAERSAQATVFTIVGVLIGGVIFFWLRWFGVDLSSTHSATSPWALTYLLALVFILFGYGSYLQALRAASRDFLRPLGAKEIARRIRNAP